MKENQIVQTGVGRKFQTPSIYRRSHGVRESGDFLSRAAAPCSVRSPSQRDAAVRDRVEEVAEMIFLKDRLDT